MNPYSRLAAALNRISRVSSVLRVRSEDDVRRRRNGTDPEIRERVELAVTRLEQVAHELEDTLA